CARGPPLPDRFASSADHRPHQPRFAPRHLASPRPGLAAARAQDVASPRRSRRLRLGPRRSTRPRLHRTRRPRRLAPLTTAAIPDGLLTTPAATRDGPLTMPPR